MNNPPRIWLDYRPVRIGWVVSNRDVAQLTAAARWNSCLWGGRFNPVIPMNDRGLSDKLICLFGVDVLLPVAPTDDTKAFIDFTIICISTCGATGYSRIGTASLSTYGMLLSVLYAKRALAPGLFSDR